MATTTQDQQHLKTSQAQLLIPNGSTQSTAYQDACKVNHLWRLALGIFPVNQELSTTYVQQMMLAANNSSLDINSIKSCFCGTCHLIFVPGITCKVTQHKRSLKSKAYKRARRIAKKKHLETGQVAPLMEMVYTCTACKSTTSICTSTRKQEGEKRARAKAKLVGTKRKSIAQVVTEPQNNIPKAEQTTKIGVIPTSILGSSSRRKKKKKQASKGTLGSFVNSIPGT